MSTQLHSTLSREELEALKEQLGTWRAVGQRLGLTYRQIQSLKQRLGIPAEAHHHKPSQLAQHHDRLVELAA